MTLRANLSPGAIDTPLPPLLVLGTTSDAACAGVAAGLAVALAEEGRSTLLVDADLRLPTLHTLFSVPRAPGLADLVESLDEQISGPRIPALVSGPRGRGTPPATPRGRGRASEGPGGARRPDGADDLRLAERLPDVTPITEHLSILPAGAARRHAAEVLRLPALGTVVQQLAHRFDVVVFHTSGRPDFPDALLLAAHVRSAVLLIRAGVDSAEHIRRVKEPLERAGVTLLGFALVGQRV